MMIWMKLQNTWQSLDLAFNGIDIRLIFRTTDDLLYGGKYGI